MEQLPPVYFLQLLMRFILPIFFCYISYYSLAQGIFKHPKSVGFSIEHIYTFKSRVTPVSQEFSNEVDVHSRGQLGFEANLYCRYKIKDKFAVNVSAIAGMYPATTRVYADREFVGGVFNITSGFSSNANFTYAGIAVGADKFFKIKKETFSANATITAIFFLPTNFSGRITSVRDLNNSSSFLVFRHLLSSNQENKIIIAPELTIKKYKKLNNRLELYFFTSGTFSSSKPIRGIYEVFGEDENISGDLNKKYAHVGLGAGMFFLTKKK